MQTRNDIELKPLNHNGVWLHPSHVYEIEVGDLVAVAYGMERTATNSLSCYMAAWLVDEQGDAQANVDTAGVPIVVDTRHNASLHEVSTLGAQGIADALLGLVLGEDPGEEPAISWSAQHRETVNIRTAIAIARATGELIDLTR